MKQSTLATRNAAAMVMFQYPIPGGAIRMIAASWQTFMYAACSVAGLYLRYSR